MSRRNHLARLKSAAPQILPSLLLCDFGNLEREIGQLEAAGVRGLHLDVMDGRFVPNLTYGMPIAAAIRQLTDLPIDAHLMIADPDKYIEAFYDAGCDIITIHAEAVADPRPVLARIRELGAGAGLAINPKMPVAAIRESISACDLILIMSVEAGFGGQAFDPTALDKLRELRALAKPGTLLEIDGGVNRDTIAACAQAGADLLVVGSAIFKQPDYKQALRELNEQCRMTNDE